MKSKPSVVFLADSGSEFAWMEELLRVCNEINSTQITYKYFSINPSILFTRKLVSEGLISPDSIDTKNLFLSRLRDLLHSLGRSNSLVVPTSYRTSLLAFVLRFTKRAQVFSLLMNQPNYFSYFPTLRIKRALHEKLRRLSVKSFDKVVCFSREVYDKHIQDKVNPSRLEIIPIGVDLSSFAEVATRRSVLEDWTRTKFLVISRLSPEKNINRILDLLNDLRKLGWSGELKIVGSGPLRQALRQKISDRLDDISVELLGQISNVTEELANCDVLIHAALTESYGQVLTEARVSGAMLVTTPVGVARDLQQIIDDFTLILGMNSDDNDATNLYEFLLRNQGKRVNHLDFLDSHDRNLCLQRIGRQLIQMSLSNGS